MSFTGRYFKVESGEVVGGPTTHAQLRHPFTSISANTTDGELAMLGFLPEDRVGFSPFDPATEKRSGPDLTVLSDRVEATYQVVLKTAQELDDEKTAAAGELFTAFALVVLDEFNVLRAALDTAGIPNMQPRTETQLRNAVKAKL